MKAQISREVLPEICRTVMVWRPLSAVGGDRPPCWKMKSNPLGKAGNGNIKKLQTALEPIRSAGLWTKAFIYLCRFTEEIFPLSLFQHGGFSKPLLSGFWFTLQRQKSVILLFKKNLIFTNTGSRQWWNLTMSVKFIYLQWNFVQTTFEQENIQFSRLANHSAGLRTECFPLTFN